MFVFHTFLITPHMQLYTGIYVIYKPWLLGVFNTWVQGQRKFATDKPEARRARVYQWQTSDDRGQGHSYDIHYRDIMLAFYMLYYTAKTVTMFSTHCISLPSDSAAFCDNRRQPCKVTWTMNSNFSLLNRRQ